MENEAIWRSKVQHDSEHDVALRGGPTGFIGGGDIKEQKLSERLSREAEIARRAKIATAVFTLRRCSTKAECAPILAILYELGLTPRERVPVIKTLHAQGFTQSEIVKALWQMETEEVPGYEDARMECEKAAGATDR
jgi:hypothetical protein